MHAGSSDLATSVRAALAAVADPARAPAMQSYMKSAMPYLGVSAVPLRKACKVRAGQRVETAGTTIELLAAPPKPA